MSRTIAPDEAARSGYKLRQRERAETFAQSPKLIRTIRTANEKELRIYIGGKPANRALMLHNFEVSAGSAPTPIGRPFYVPFGAAGDLAVILADVAREVCKLHERSAS